MGIYAHIYGLCPTDEKNWGITVKVGVRFICPMDEKDWGATVKVGGTVHMEIFTRHECDIDQTIPLINSFLLVFI